MTASVLSAMKDFNKELLEWVYKQKKSQVLWVEPKATNCCSFGRFYWFELCYAPIEFPFVLRRPLFCQNRYPWGSRFRVIIHIMFNNAMDFEVFRACHENASVSWILSSSGLIYCSFQARVVDDHILIASWVYREPGCSPRRKGEPSCLLPVNKKECCSSYSKDNYFVFNCVPLEKLETSKRGDLGCL